MCLSCYVSFPWDGTWPRATFHAARAPPVGALTAILPELPRPTRRSGTTRGSDREFHPELCSWEPGVRPLSHAILQSWTPGRACSDTPHRDAATRVVCPLGWRRDVGTHVMHQTARFSQAPVKGRPVARCVYNNPCFSQTPAKGRPVAGLLRHGPGWGGPVAGWGSRM